tara:strand:+ start:531 stop:782 length:252 start_codon:yes stop_codon:yes gene_type:complete
MFLFSTSFLLSKESIEEDYNKIKGTIFLKALKSGKVIDQRNNQLEYNASNKCVTSSDLDWAVNDIKQHIESWSTFPKRLKLRK